MMKKMELSVQTNPKKYFRQLLEILDFTPKFSILSNREKDVLAELEYYNWMYKSLVQEDKWALINSVEIRERMRTSTSLSKEGFNNLLTSLRKKNVITFAGIRKDYELSPSDGLFIKFISDADR
jgi:hypothetical protein